jgi:hypothetical protein
MKIKKTLSRDHYQSFFWDDIMHHGLCLDFIKNLLSVKEDITGKVEVTVSTINPKTKNFRKITRTSESEILLNSKEFKNSKKFSVCYAELQLLDSLGIDINESFWMKAVK